MVIDRLAEVTLAVPVTEGVIRWVCLGDELDVADADVCAWLDCSLMITVLLALGVSDTEHACEGVAEATGVSAEVAVEEPDGVALWLRIRDEL